MRIIIYGIKAKVIWLQDPNTIDRLMHNIRSIGFNESKIWKLTSFVPLREAHYLKQLKSREIIPFSFVNETKIRTHFKASNPELVLT